MSNEEKEKRVREEGDKLAKKVSEKMSGVEVDREQILKALPKGELTINPTDKNEVSDPESIKRYLEMIGKI